MHLYYDADIKQLYCAEKKLTGLHKIQSMYYAEMKRLWNSLKHIVLCT